jgi:hypothetical protein
MNSKRWLALGVVLVAIILVVITMRQQPCCRPNTVEGFLSDTGDVVRFDRKLVASLCQLEDSTQGVDPSKRICPTGDPNDVPIPTYPPKQ